MKTRPAKTNDSNAALYAKFMHLITLLTLGFSTFATSEELTNVKVIGGFNAECSEANSAQTNYLQPIIFNLIDSKKSGSTTSAEFEVQFVECLKGKWSKLKNIKTEFNQNITDEVKQNYKEKTIYSKFRVEIRNTKDEAIQTITLDTTKGRSTFKVKFNSLDFTKDEETNTKFVDVIMMANRARQNAADFYYDDINWGRVRLPLTQPGN